MTGVLVYFTGGCPWIIPISIKNLAQGLKELRRRIDLANLPSSKLDENFNLATWNIREFGRRRRLKASLRYIAEIIGQFDLVAVTEVRDNLSDLNEVLELLGPYWKAIFSDYTTDAGGNRERAAYIYDERAVQFTGLAAEADPPRKKDKSSGEYVSKLSWWRPPYVASFRAGNFDFILLTAHIRWGKRKADRIKPLLLLAEWVEKRMKQKHGFDKDIIVLGDFNIPKIDDDLFQAVTSRGLRIPKALRGVSHGSNLEKNKRYDQILHYPVYTDCFSDHAGVLDFYQKNHKALYPGKTMSKRQFTYQISDHLPLWIQVNTDTADEELDQTIRRKKKKKKS